MNRYNDCLPLILKHEGGKVDDPADKGGRTSCGITQRTYDSWRKTIGMQPKDVWEITPTEISAIYRTRYWAPCGAQLLPEPLDMIVFDTAVLFGPRRAVMFLQIALGMPSAECDGVCGQHTAAHASESDTAHQTDWVGRRIIDQREAYHRARVANDPTQERFLAGWLARCDDLRKLVQI